MPHLNTPPRWAWVLSLIMDYMDWCGSHEEDRVCIAQVDPTLALRLEDFMRKQGVKAMAFGFNFLL